MIPSSSRECAAMEMAMRWHSISRAIIRAANWSSTASSNASASDCRASMSTTLLCSTPGNCSRSVSPVRRFGMREDRSSASSDSCATTRGLSCSAPVPSGGVWVIPQEDVTREGDHITVTREGSANIRAAGDDFGTGWQLRPRLLSPADLALLAAMNIDRVPVRKRPEVAIICTGDELVMPGEEPGPDQIIASNGFALAAMVEQAGGVARMLPIAQDRVESLGAVFELARGADVVVTVGGASVGEHDVVAKAAEGLGLERRFWKIAMRPGKPLIAGRIFGVPMLGMPGNPVSAIVCAQLFLLPLLRVMQGDPAPAPRYLRAELAVDDGPAGPRTHFMRATLADGPGLPLITPCSRQDSALLTVLAEAQALLVRPAGDGPRRAGEIVPYLPL